ncbi:hypothetical protein PWT90_07793 [Aphanocladium album]|nr:hypothetical protein PWT90_07793 [Aphanocladium album]
MPTVTRQSRVVGALLGLHAGDSLGATVEFKSHGFIKATYPGGHGSIRDITGGGVFKWPAGHATDDTDMMRGVLLAYHDHLAGDQHHAKEDVATRAGRYFLKWRSGDWPGRKHGTRPVDIGAACDEGLARFAQTLDPDRAGAGKGRAGNGSLMRCLPTGLFRAGDTDRLVAESIRISKITHDDVLCTYACAVYNVMVAELVGDRSPAEAVDAGIRLCRKLEHSLEKQPVLNAMKLGTQLRLQGLAKFGPPPAVMPGECSGYVLDSLSVAVAALLDPRCLEDILVDMVRIGKDTDTNTAIAGGLLGARDGEDAIPRRWEEKLQFGEEFRTIATNILRSQSKK